MGQGGGGRGGGRWGAEPAVPCAAAGEGGRMGQGGGGRGGGSWGAHGAWGARGAWGRDAGGPPACCPRLHADIPPPSLSLSLAVDQHPPRCTPQCDPELHAYIRGLQEPALEVPYFALRCVGVCALQRCSLCLPHAHTPRHHTHATTNTRHAPHASPPHRVQLVRDLVCPPNMHSNTHAPPPPHPHRAQLVHDLVCPRPALPRLGGSPL